LRKRIAFCGAARRLTVIFHRGPHAEMSLRPLTYLINNLLRPQHSIRRILHLQ